MTRIGRRETRLSRVPPTLVRSPTTDSTRPPKSRRFESRTLVRWPAGSGTDRAESRRRVGQPVSRRQAATPAGFVRVALRHRRPQGHRRECHVSAPPLRRRASAGMLPWSHGDAPGTPDRCRIARDPTGSSACAGRKPGNSTTAPPASAGGSRARAGNIPGTGSRQSH